MHWARDIYEWALIAWSLIAAGIWLGAVEKQLRK